MKSNQLFVNKIYSDHDIKNLEGTWIDESYIKHPIINTNTDVYYNDNGVYKLLLKFRKNVIPDDIIDIGWNSYKNLAKPSRGRGASAGPINSSGQYWSKRTLLNTKKWSTGYLKPDGNPSKMRVNNQVLSNPVGYFESSKNFSDLPCRLTHFTKTNYDNYIQGLPFIQHIDKLFQKLIPSAHEKQLNRANFKNKFKIPNTSFSTVTINRNFRTALHRDAGDFKEGFGNLTVIERGKYHGGYTVFPQFGVAIDLRNNDFVAMDVHQWHSNTQIYETESDKIYNSTLKSDFKDNPNVGTEGIYTNYTRLSFVCYLRENIINCKN